MRYGNQLSQWDKNFRTVTASDEPSNSFYILLESEIGARKYWFLDDSKTILQFERVIIKSKIWHFDIITLNVDNAIFEVFSVQVILPCQFSEL